MRALFVGLVALGGACRPNPEALRGDVQIVAGHEGAVMQAAVGRLVRHGRAALVPIETALHRADAPGRKNLLFALRQIGDAEAIALLRQVALFDADPEVRREARWTLEQWAAGTDERAVRARAVVQEMDERQGREGAG